MTNFSHDDRPTKHGARTSPRPWQLVLLVACVLASSLASLPATWGEEVTIESPSDGAGLLVTVTASHEPTVSGDWRASSRTSFPREDAGSEWTGTGAFYVPPDTGEIIASIGGSCGGCCGGVCPQGSIAVTATQEVGAWELETESGEYTSAIDPEDGATHPGVIESSRRPFLDLTVNFVSSEAQGYVTDPVRRPGTNTWDFSVRWFPARPGGVAIDPAESTWSVYAQSLGYCPSTTDCDPGADDFLGPISVSAATP